MFLSCFSTVLGLVGGALGGRRVRAELVFRHTSMLLAAGLHGITRSIDWFKSALRYEKSGEDGQYVAPRCASVSIHSFDPTESGLSEQHSALQAPRALQGSEH